MEILNVRLSAIPFMISYFVISNLEKTPLSKNKIKLGVKPGAILEFTDSAIWNGIRELTVLAVAT